MLALEVTINVFVILGIAVFALTIGYMAKSAQLGKNKKRIYELETEMLNNHASILELQQEISTLEKTLMESKIPVIPIKKSKEEESAEKKNTGM
jgi:hypothetical protein